MRDRSKPPTKLTAGSKAPASALREHISRELAAETASDRTHSKSTRAHSKSTPDDPAIPSLSASQRRD